MKSRGSALWALLFVLFFAAFASTNAKAVKLSSDLPTNTLFWVCSLPAAIVGSPALSSDSTTLYVAANNRRFYAIDTASGETNWIVKLPAIPTSSPIVDDDDSIYIGCADGLLHRIIVDGDGFGQIDTLFHPFIGGRLPSPAIDDDGFLYASGTANHLYALRSDGSKFWAYSSSNNIGAPIVVEDTIFVVSGGYVRGLDFDSGTENSSFTPRASINSIPAVGDDGTLYFGANDDRVYALNSAGTTNNWRFNTGKDVFSSPAVGVDGSIYIASDNLRLYRLNTNGVPTVWTNRPSTRAPVRSPLSIGPDGTIYAGCDDGRLYAFSERDGRILWTVKGRAPIRSSAVVDSVGTVYFNSGRIVYAVTNNVTEDIGEPAWQMFRKDRKHTAHATVNVAVTNLPSITQGPEDLMVGEGTSAIFSIRARGNPEPSYQWYFSTNAISSAVNPTATTTNLLLTGVQGSNAGFYFAVAANPGGSVTSSVAGLTVTNLTTVWFPQSNGVGTPLSNARPFIVRQITNQFAEVSGSVGFSIGVEGGRPLFYQWYFNSNAISLGANATATDPILTITNAAIGDSGVYYVIATNAFGGVTSAVVTLSVTLTSGPPVIVQQPAGHSALTNTTTSFSVSVVGAQPFDFQWRHNATPINTASNATATNATIVISNVVALNDAGFYDVVVTNSFGSITSVAVLLIVTNGPDGGINPPGADQRSLAKQGQSFVISSIVTAGTTVTIGAAPVADRKRLVLEYKEGLSDPEWKPLGTNDVGDLKLIDPAPPLDRSRYYRVRAE